MLDFCPYLRFGFVLCFVSITQRVVAVSLLVGKVFCTGRLFTDRHSLARIGRITPVFEGMNTLKRSQPILGLFKAELASGKLHAQSVKVKTPKEQASLAGLVQIQGL
jgi:hypothetical protein